RLVPLEAIHGAERDVYLLLSLRKSEVTGISSLAGEPLQLLAKLCLLAAIEGQDGHLPGALICAGTGLRPGDKGLYFVDDLLRFRDTPVSRPFSFLVLRLYFQP